MRKRRSMYRVLIGKSEGKRQIRRPRRRCEDNIKLHLHGGGMWGYGLDRAGSG